MYPGYIKRSYGRIFQGDILSNIEYSIDKIEGDSLKTISFNLPFVVVLSQDCDLESDYDNRNESPVQNHDKYLQSVLICPAYLAESVKQGKHFEEIGLSMVSWSTDPWRQIRSNNNQRFHFLPADPENNIPDLILDFKHFHTLSREKLYKDYNNNYQASLADLFKEDISQRFSSYLSRIGLPIPRPQKTP